jgi:hypothetical protein
MTLIRPQGGWHGEIARVNVLRHMANVGMSAAVFEYMTEHDAVDAEMTGDWLRLRRLGFSWAALARCDAEALGDLE